MGQNNYLRLVWIAAYLLFAAISCVATAESLHLLLPDWPKLLFYACAVGFFIIASLGSKMIVDSFNQNIYLERRGLRLIGGIVILLVFWVCFSLPTNTHTFFYRNAIRDVISADISTTKGYLAQIKENKSNKDQAQIKVNELKNNINVKLGELEAEIMNEANPGFGPKSKEILRQIAAMLGVAKIEPLTYRGTSHQDRVRLCDAYRAKIFAIAENVAVGIVKHVMTPSTKAMEDADKCLKNLTVLEKYIDEGTIDLFDAEQMVDANKRIITGYNLIRQNRVFINFDPKTDEAKYTAENPVTRERRMMSVIDTWVDFFDGKFAGYGFAIWIFLAVLVDVAAFIFFDLAFAKKDN